MKFLSSRFRTRSARGAATAVAAAFLALPAAGHAAVMTLGSDLSKPANRVEARGPDVSFWNTLIDGQPNAMPADGQVTFVRMKGAVIDDPQTYRFDPDKPLDPQIHFQTLHPIDGGRRMRVELSTATFRLPVVSARDRTPDTQQITGYTPVNLCVHKGDYISFNDFGGFEWSWPRDPQSVPENERQGMHVQVFSDGAQDSVFGHYSKNNGLNINSEWGPDGFNRSQELLMQTRLATGRDATDICPGGYMQHVFRGLNIKRRTASLSARKRTVKVAVQCPVSTYGSCKGVLVLKAPINGTVTTLGGIPFNVRYSFGTSLLVTLSDKITKKVLKLGGVTATATAEAHDDPRHDKRADPAVPVQKKTTSAKFRIEPSS